MRIFFIGVTLILVLLAITVEKGTSLPQMGDNSRSPTLHTEGSMPEPVEQSENIPQMLYFYYSYLFHSL
jgi:hypothetical protein